MVVDHLGSMPPLASLAGLPTVSTEQASHTGGPGAAGSPVTERLGHPTAASHVTNMLPWARLEPTPDPQGGVYVGEGLPPVPQKIADRICRGEFVDMAEMLPEFWPVTGTEEGDHKKSAPQKLRQVTDFQTWLQCFAIYCSIRGSHDPGSVPELMAYIITISRVSQDFTGLSWVRYDSAFRCQAAISGNKRWSQINPPLYSLCFAGRAQEGRRCELCLSTVYMAARCPLQAEGDPELPTRVKAVESAVLSLVQSRPPVPSWQRPNAEVCRAWNANKCRFPWCRYRHVCSVCGEAHPVVACPKGSGRAGMVPEGRSPGGSRQTRREAPNPAGGAQPLLAGGANSNDYLTGLAVVQCRGRR